MVGRKPKAGDDGMLHKYEHHRRMAEKHRAHADLIEARLRTQGKRIAHEYPETAPSSGKSAPKRRIVADHV